MRGSHCLRTYSTTQKFVTLSSGEAELMAIERAATEAIGIAQLAQSWGISLQASVLTDSSAALAITCRKGNGRLRHVKIGHLWIQEKAESGDVHFRKVRGETNPADLGTKHVPAHRLVALSQLLGQSVRPGQAQCKLALDRVASAYWGNSSPQRPRRGTERSPCTSLLHVSCVGVSDCIALL